jgi:hypothetical protein
MNIQSISAVTNYYQPSYSAGPVSVAQALSAAKQNPRLKFDLQDSAANIEKNFNSLASLVNNFKTITLTDTAPGLINVSAQQFFSYGGNLLIGKMSLGGYNNPIGLSVSNVLAKDISLVNSKEKVTTFSVKDTSANLSTKFEILKNSEFKLSDVSVTTTAFPLKLNLSQYTSGTSVLNHIVGTYGLEISGASASQAITIANDDKVTQVNIVDHAQNIADKLDALQNMGLKLKSAVSDDTNVFKISSEQLKKDGAAIGKIYKGYQLAVFNLDASTALSVKSNKKIVSLDVVDTAEGISKNLALLSKLGSQLHSIQIADSAPLPLTAKNYFTYGNVLSKIVEVKSGDAPITDQPVDPSNTNNNYQLDITDARAVDAQAIKNDSKINSISVRDINTAIGINLDDLNANALVKNINVLGTNATIDISASQWQDDSSTVSLLKSQNGNIKFNLNGVAADVAKSFLSDASNRIASVSVADTAAKIVTNLNDLASLGKNLTSIVQTDARQQAAPGELLSMTASNWMTNIGVLSKIVGGYGINLTEISANKALSYANDIRVKSFQVTDTGTAIGTNLQGLQNLGSKLSSITQSDTSPIQVSGQQYNAYQSTLGKLDGSYKLSVTSAAANQIATLVADKDHIQSIQVLDTVANVTSNLSSLETAALLDQNDTSISVSLASSSQPFSLSATQVNDYSNALKTISGNFKVMVSDVNAADAKDFATTSDLAVNSHLLSMAVKASASDLKDSQQLADLNALGNKISKISQTDTGTTIALKLTDWQNNANVFAKLPGYQVALSEVKAASAKNLVANDHVESVKVLDTYSQISQNFDKLVALGHSVTEISQSSGDSGNIQLSMSQWNQGTETLGKITSDYHVDITGASAKDAGDLSGEDSVAHVAVNDTAIEVSAKFNQLASNSKVSSVSLSTTGVPISLTQAQLTDNSSFMSKFAGGYTLAVKDSSTADVSGLLSNTHVVSAEVKGAGSDIVTALSDLNKLGPRLKTLSLTDTNPSLSLSFSDFQKYKNVLGLIKQPFTVALNQIKASDAVLEGQDTQFNVNMRVQDTTSQIAANLDALAELKGKLISITTSDPTTPLAIKSSQFLADQSALSKMNVSGQAASYKVALTGGDLSAAKYILADGTLAPHVLTMDLNDDADAVSKGFDYLSNSKITAVHLAVAGQTVALSGDQYAQSSSLAKVKGVFSLRVSGAQSSQAQSLESDSRVVGYSLAATSSAIGTGLSGLLALDKLEQIDLTQDQTRMSLTMTQFNTVQDSLSKISGNFELNVTQAQMSDLATLNSESAVYGVQVKDSSELIANDWGTILSMGDKILSIENTSPTVPLAIDYAQWSQSSDALAKLDASQPLTILNVPPDLATTASGYAHVSSISVSGSTDQVALSFDDLVGLGNKLESIVLSNDGPLELTQAQVDSDVDGKTLAKIDGGYDLTIVS